MPVPNGAQTHEISIPNDLIGCIIGRGGSKINEIRSVFAAWRLLSAFMTYVTPNVGLADIVVMYNKVVHVTRFCGFL